jgi:hypothetical protein
MQANNVDIEYADMSKALVAITPDAASIPTPKLKNVSRLRTEHQVYVTLALTKFIVIDNNLCSFISYTICITDEVHTCLFNLFIFICLQL